MNFVRGIVPMKIVDVGKAFDHWMKTYDHRGDSHAQSFRNFITCDSEIIDSGVSYDEYVSLAFHLNNNGYKIEWIIPHETYKDAYQDAMSRRSSRRE